jgi:long-subunit acyl-CoA synthetase (AMP-forming)
VVAKISDQPHAVRRVVVVGAGGDYEQWLAGASPEEPAHQATPDDCLMQMYTSDTTGFPKGAMLTHRSMIAHVRAGVPVFGFDADSVALVAMPLFHVSGTAAADLLNQLTQLHDDDLLTDDEYAAKRAEVIGRI